MRVAGSHIDLITIILVALLVAERMGSILQTAVLLNFIESRSSKYTSSLRPEGLGLGTYQVRPLLLLESIAAKGTPNSSQFLFWSSLAAKGQSDGQVH